MSNSTRESRIFTASYEGQEATITTKRALRWATIARWNGEAAVMIGWSIADTHDKARKAARSTAPYAVEWDAIPVQEVQT